MKLIKDFIDKEEAILLWIQNNIRNRFLNKIFIAITYMGDGGAVWIAASLIFILNKRTRSIGFITIFSIVCTVIINNILIKKMVSRIRPYSKCSRIELLIEKQRDFSFPSGHTASSFAAAVVIYKNIPNALGISALILAGLIGFSRMYVGVHYFSDVICGIISGIFIAEVVSYIFI